VLGESQPVYIIAEMSANHGGSVNKAKEILHAAKEVGASAVKLQTYRADTITLDSEREDFKIPSNNPWSQADTLYKLYDRAHTPWEWHEELFQLGQDLSIDILSSPFDQTAVDLLESLNCPAFKIASPEITDIPLIKYIAQKAKPVILSTGIADKNDIDLAVNTIRNEGNDQIIILQCTSAYPTPFEAMNLATIKSIPKTFGCMAGLSDHSPGILAPVISVAFGAVMIEKHFILSKKDESDDNFFSLDVQEFGELVTSVRNAEKIIGSETFDLNKEKQKNRWGRRSLYLTKPIKQGEVFTKEHIKSVRPGYGLHPKHLETVLGSVATRDLNYADRLTWDCFNCEK
jgi:N-acetylneuraminate synthase/pseudaminic acid synthase